MATSIQNRREGIISYLARCEAGATARELAEAKPHLFDSTDWNTTLNCYGGEQRIQKAQINRASSTLRRLAKRGTIQVVEHGAHDGSHVYHHPAAKIG